MSMTLAWVADNPWRSLFAEVATAKWLADVGIPLFATLAALGLAYYGLRRQMKHDRELAAAERRSHAASAFAAAIRELTGELRDRGDSDPYWQTSDWAGSTSLFRAIGSATVVLGDEVAIAGAESCCCEIMSIWGYCADTHRKLQLNGYDPDIDMSDHVQVLREAISPAVAHLESLVPLWARWDGFGAMPARHFDRAHGEIAGIAASWHRSIAIREDYEAARRELAEGHALEDGRPFPPAMG
jgi:hypothetical protein